MPSPGPQPSDPHQPYSSQTVSVNWDEDAATPGSRRFEFGLSECIETKTVTTTTTTKRTFPPLFVREPRPLESLDVKEYPLASKPTPPQLAQFSFDVPGFDLFGDDTKQTRRTPADKKPLRLSRTTFENNNNNPSPVDSRNDARNSRLASPSEPYPRRSRRTTTRPDSPSSCVSKRSTRSRVASSQHYADSNKPRLSGQGSRRESERLARQVAAGLLATPDASEFHNINDRPNRPRSLQLDRRSPTPEDTIAYEAASPVASESQTIFSGNVATPPITDADAEPFMDADESLQQSIRSIHARHPLEVAAAQDVDASLPSPRLSPKLTASQPQLLDQSADDEDALDADALDVTPSLTQQDSWHIDSFQSASTDESEPSSHTLVGRSREVAREPPTPMSQLVDPRVMLDTFDAMPSDMKTLMLYQFLRRCPRGTLRVVADVVNPSLQCDFLKQLPLELSYHVLSYLDYRDLCRASKVSKHWRAITDCNETGWKELFDRDGYKLPPGELEKAIRQGWGWQDPYGPREGEVDLSANRRLNSTEAELTQVAIKPEPSSRLRSSKRKRAPTATPGAERSKRRGNISSALKDGGSHEPRQHRSEGPLSAASAAALAVPNPPVGLPSLRRLHLFKSLYRRHHFFRKSWTSGKVQPGHVAFTAHAQHVITCLQFDDDKIITGSDDTLIHVYDTKTGKLRKRLEGHEGGVWALQYEDNILVSGSTDRSVRVWDIEKGLCTQVFYGHTSTVRCLQILMPSLVPNEQTKQLERMPPKPLIITGSRDNNLRVWRLPEAGSRRYIQTGPPANDSDCPYFIRTLTGHAHSVRAIAAHGDTLVSGSYDNTVRVWRISTGEARHVLSGHSQKVYSVVLDQKRNRCISGAMDALVKIWDLTSGTCLFTLAGHSLLVGILDLQDERLVSAAADSTLRIWDPETGRCKNVLSAHTGAITCFQHDGQKVISGSERTVKMWDVATGNCMTDLLTDLGSVWQLKFDYRRCVAAVQREGLTYIEILDFGAVRDGTPPEELGKRILLDEAEVQRLMEEE
ncbi:related to CDC4 - cell division control protein [Cephalotrichum gorgonifer]|uniref:Related to CDC4 - cell division control protein n=1 Tax=Cephalotrichum gorgonifer TaxID=2041049 RepID=A0AAE8SY72_9PEZI|nr:related to CDC4 - cell division control protein [Cephalotrichum gorgonifer]